MSCKKFFPASGHLEPKVFTCGGKPLTQKYKRGPHSATFLLIGTLSYPHLPASLSDIPTKSHPLNESFFCAAKERALRPAVEGRVGEDLRQLLFSL